MRKLRPRKYIKPDQPIRVTLTLNIIVFIFVICELS